LKIDFKAEARASTLSGGQKRKLSLAIALIGGSEVRKKFLTAQYLNIFRS
jgi:ABC-type multidrug transport system ATPase subunit